MYLQYRKNSQVSILFTWMHCALKHRLLSSVPSSSPLCCTVKRYHLLAKDMQESHMWLSDELHFCTICIIHASTQTNYVVYMYHPLCMYNMVAILLMHAWPPSTTQPTEGLYSM